MTTELKPGYWKTRNGWTAYVIGPNPFYEDAWCGIIRGAGARSWFGDGGYCEEHETSVDLVEYLGPTLPPDPGPGWRLLKKWPEPEPTIEGDECFFNGSWMYSVNWETDNGRQGILWYRRRETPEPPTPPEGWELLPDGTPGRPEYLRLWQSLHGKSPHLWASAAGINSLETRRSGEVFNGDRLWYARRIEPEPQWVPTDEYRAYAVVKGPDGNCVRVWCRVEEVERRYVMGEDVEWRDVGVQE